MPRIIKDKKIIIFDKAEIVNIENIEFGNYIVIDDFTFIYAKEKIKIGNYVHISVGVLISGGERIEIEDFVGISAGVKIFTTSDDFTDCGFGNPTISERYRNLKKGKVKIGKFAIIGANTVILPGVEIGEGAAIGACSVVNKNIKPWGIYVNNKLIGFRNKDKVLKNYELFLKDETKNKIGNIFKKFGIEK